MTNVRLYLLQSLAKQRLMYFDTGCLRPICKHELGSAYRAVLSVAVSERPQIMMLGCFPVTPTYLASTFLHNDGSDCIRHF